MDWYPVVPGTVKFVANGVTYVDDGAGKLIAVPAGGSVVRRMITETTSGNTISGTPTRMEVKVLDNTGAEVTASSGTVYYGPEDVKTALTPISFNAGIVLSVSITATDCDLLYNYNNVVIPQNDLPIYNAEMKAIPLVAKARRIAIFFSQIASFQA